MTPAAVSPAPRSPQLKRVDDTLVIWHGEFGRIPISQRGVGRDHNPGVQTVWMAGARIKGGQPIASSDEVDL